MGKTYRKNEGWKRDRRDQNFKKSKKFKDFKDGHLQPKHNRPVTESDSQDSDVDTN